MAISLISNQGYYLNLKKMRNTDALLGIEPVSSFS